MLLKIKKQIGKWRETLTTAPCVAGLVIGGTLAGLFQPLEWMALDEFFRHRPQESVDSRIALVTFDESDIEYLKHWPISDATLAKSIEKLQEYRPRAIGLDIYRNLPVEPGYLELVKVFKASPNTVGIEKALGDRVGPPVALPDLDRVALADLMVDSDAGVRRGLIFVKEPDSPIRFGLGTMLALMYLEAEGISLAPANIDFPSSMWQKSGLKLGKALFVPFTGNDGGYVRADKGGYQILLNYLGKKDKFVNVSLQDVLEDKVPPDLLRDRVVLVGSIAPSLNDFLQTPYEKKTPGIVIHANIAAQIIAAALDGRPLLHVLPDPLEWLWILVWAFIGAAIAKGLVQTIVFKDNPFSFLGILVFGALSTGVVLVLLAYLAFLAGWWISVVSPLIAVGGSTLVMGSYQVQDWKRTAFMDSLTKIANRRFFEQYLHRQWLRHMGGKNYMSIILCDVDCFKLYNDTYGHQAGDNCLQQVANAMKKCVPASNLVARYGGEEFVVILPDTTNEMALRIAQKLCAAVKALQIPHAKTKANSQYVTLSCGVASIIPDFDSSPASSIAIADKALYDAKERGRDRAVSHFES